MRKSAFLIFIVISVLAWAQQNQTNGSPSPSDVAHGSQVSGNQFQVAPQTIGAGTTTDITLSGSGVSALLPKIAGLSKVNVYSDPTSGSPAKVSTITVGRPSQQGASNQIRLGLSISTDALAGNYELYENSNPTGAIFKVTAGGSVQPARRRATCGVTPNSRTVSTKSRVS